MQNEKLKNKIAKILDESKVGTLATVQNQKPHSRYMTFFHEDFTLLTATSRQTHKTEEVEKNPYVHILLGYSGEGYGDPYLEIEGTAKVNDTKEMKHELWNENFEPWFEGPDDPDYIILEIKPSKIRLMNDKEEDPAILEF